MPNCKPASLHIDAEIVSQGSSLPRNSQSWRTEVILRAEKTLLQKTDMSKSPLLNSEGREMAKNSVQRSSSCDVGNLLDCSKMREGLPLRRQVSDDHRPKNVRTIRELSRHVPSLAVNSPLESPRSSLVASEHRTTAQGSSTKFHDDCVSSVRSGSHCGPPIGSLLQTGGSSAGEEEDETNDARFLEELLKSKDRSWIVKQIKKSLDLHRLHASGGCDGEVAKSSSTASTVHGGLEASLQWKQTRKSRRSKSSDWDHAGQPWLQPAATSLETTPRSVFGTQFNYPERDSAIDSHFVSV